MLRVFHWRRYSDIWNSRVSLSMCQKYHSFICKHYTSVIKWCTRNGSFGWTMFAKYFTSIIYVMVIVKLSILNTLSVFWHAPVIATCGYQGNRRTKVDAVSPTLYSKITLQEDNNTSERTSTAYAKDCMLKCVCFNSFWTSLVYILFQVVNS